MRYFVAKRKFQVTIYFQNKKALLVHILEGIGNAFRHMHRTGVVLQVSGLSGPEEGHSCSPEGCKCMAFGKCIVKYF